MSRLTALVVLAVLALAACQPKVVAYELQVHVETCGGTAPLDGATHMLVRVRGEDLSPLERVAPVEEGRLELPDIPVGKARVLEVRALSGDPRNGGEVLAIGRSAPFDVSNEVTDAPLALNVSLRRVNTFSPVNALSSPRTCASMLTSRAAHTATLLPNGQVLIAGGFNVTTGNQRVTVFKTELFDPATGTFTQAPDLGVTSPDQRFSVMPRAFHTATLLQNGQVLLAGGEVASGATDFPLRSALVYDPVAKSYGSVTLESARTRHAATQDNAGRVMLVGGVATAAGVPASKVEWYDPISAKVIVLAQTLPRLGAVAASVQGGSYIAVAGGSDGEVLRDEVLFFSHDGQTFTQAASTIRLRKRRRAAAVASFQDGNRLVLIGGYTTPLETSPLAPTSTSEVLTTGTSFTVAEGPYLTARGDACAAVLPGGRVLAAGGRSVDAAQRPRSSPSAELLSSLEDGSAELTALPPLPRGRHFHTCTPLNDGSVLVLGGVHEEGGVVTALNDAFIFMPAPVD